jgi:hypothetical protein
MWVQPFRNAELEIVPPKPAGGEAKVAVLLNANARKVTERIVRTLSHAVPEGDLFLSKSELDSRRTPRPCSIAATTRSSSAGATARSWAS